MITREEEEERGLSVKYRVTLVCCGCVVLSHWDDGEELDADPCLSEQTDDF